MPNLEPEKFTLLQWIVGLGTIGLGAIPVVRKFLVKASRVQVDDADTDLVTRGESKTLAIEVAKNALLQKRLDERELWDKIEIRAQGIEAAAEEVARANREMFYGKLNEVLQQLAGLKAQYELVLQDQSNIESDIRALREDMREAKDARPRQR